MKLYDPKFVHFEWSDKLDGQYCFVADNINWLIKRVNSNDTTHLLKVSKGTESYPFEYGKETSGNYRFAYYDPNYDVKYAYFVQHKDIYVTLRNRNIDWMKIEKEGTFLDYIDDPDYEFKIEDDFTELLEAYKQGKTIQHMNLDGDWVDCDMPVSFGANHSYRVKPEEKEFEIVIIYGIGLRIIQSTPNGNRKILFKGTEKECEEWLKDNKDIQIAVNGYFSDKDIMYKGKGVKNDPWRPTKDTPYEWDFDHYEYRIKPEEKKVQQDEIEELDYKLTVKTEFHKGNTIYYRNKTIDDSEWHPFSKATAGKDYHFDFDTYEYKMDSKEIVDESENTLYRPFNDTNELIAYWDKHYGNGNRPEYTMPLIWVKGKETGNVYLITGYEENEYVCIGGADWWLNMKDLFEQCKFLDGKFCGMVGK